MIKVYHFFPRHFHQYFSYIMANSFSGGGSQEYPERSTDHGQATGKLYHLRPLLQINAYNFMNTFMHKIFTSRSCDLLSKGPGWLNELGRWI
jgi:hypothetical protein